MFYRVASNSNVDLVRGLKEGGIVTLPKVEEAMLKVDRAAYAPLPEASYNDNPLPIGHGQTISAPHMHAMCLELLHDNITKENSKILDVGHGSGYLAACMGRMCGSNGKVIGIEVIPELLTLSQTNINKNDSDLIQSGTVVLKQGDGWKGEPDAAPFDAIHVGAAASSLPTALVEQLAVGGRLIIPVGVHTQHLYQVDKKEGGEIEKKIITGVQYVPLVQKD